MTLVAVCLGVFLVAPGLGIIVAILVAPALIHVLVGRHREAGAGKPTTAGARLASAAATTAAALAALALGGTAFGVAIFASCIVESRVLAPRMPAGSQDLVAFTLIGISSLIGLVAAGCVYAMLRPRR
jgi:hypothetical protein